MVMGEYGDISWAGRASDRWGHWGAGVLIVSIMAAIGLGVRPLPATTPLAVWMPLGLFAVVIVSWLKMRQHDRRLCELCVHAMPLNAAELAASMHRRFAVAHAGERRSVLIGYLVVLLGSNGLLLAGMTGRICWALVQSSMIYLVLAYSSHRRFQPWCPNCRGGGHEDRESTVVPDPLPQGGMP
jgi:hypothetical protein